MTWRNRRGRSSEAGMSRLRLSALARCASALAVPALALLCSCGNELPATAPAGSAPGAIRAADVWKHGEVYVCRRARGKITIDTNDHPNQWKHAMLIQGFFIPITHEPPRSQTAAQMLWDDEYLYVRAVARDTDLRGTLKGRFARLWTEDAVELFLKPPAPDGYYEFEMSPTSVLLDLQIPIGRQTTYEQRAEWESDSPLAVAVKGTIETPADTDEYYRILMAIPWKNLAYGGGRAPRIGEKWRFIFARCDRSRRYGGGQELSACIRLPKVDFHMYGIYPEMKFAK